MKCPQCGSEQYHKDGKEPGTVMQRFKCKDCGRAYNENTALKSETIMEKKSTVGMTIEQFRQKHDVNYIVKKTLKTLPTKLLLSRTEVIKLTGLRNGYPGLRDALDNADEYRLKIDGTEYFATPETIKEALNAFDEP